MVSTCCCADPRLTIKVTMDLGDLLHKTAVHLKAVFAHYKWKANQLSSCNSTQKVEEIESPVQMSETCARSCGNTTAAISPVTSGQDTFTRCTHEHHSPYNAVTLVRAVGRGSFGKVYYANWMNSHVAVKIVRWNKMSRKGRGNPIVEADLSLKLAHPHLVGALKYFYQDIPQTEEEENGEAEWRKLGIQSTSEMLEAWIIQEWCDLGTLCSFCKVPRYGEQHKDEVKAMFTDIVSAGAYLHSCNVIHGDLTGNNVLLRSDCSCKGFSCKISDFGLSRILKAECSDIQTTQMGTVSYMPPELFDDDLGHVQLSPATDVFSAGIVLWQIVTGSTPFAGCSPPQIILRVVTGRGLTLSDAPVEFVKLFNQCTVIDPSRPQFNDFIACLSPPFQM